jgi:mannose-6-phosphate isomerase-like protein (cupin superfamily)
MTDLLQITPGETLDVVDRAADVLVFDARWAPGGSAAPPHYHPAQDEHFEVLEGALTVDVAGERRRLQAGETLDIPRGTKHRMWNPDEQPARARWETRPPGRTESWFAALAALQGTEHVDGSGRPKPLPFAALADEYRTPSGWPSARPRSAASSSARWRGSRARPAARLADANGVPGPSRRISGSESPSADDHELASNAKALNELVATFKLTG